MTRNAVEGASIGLLFESLVIRDLRVLAQPLGGTVLHYRDNLGGEADAVVQLADGRWAGFEIKLGAGLVDEERPPCFGSARVSTPTRAVSRSPSAS